MDEEAGFLDGDQIITRDTRIAGIVSGSVAVVDGVAVEVSGIVSGDLFVGAGAHAKITGIVDGMVTNAGGSVSIYGVVGAVYDPDGFTHVAPDAVVRGQLSHLRATLQGVLRWCEDYDGELTETTNEPDMSSAERRYYCPACGAEWVADASNDLKPVEG